LRIDEAELVLGLRLNVWTSIVVGVGALIAFIVVGRRHPGREEAVSLDVPDEAPTAGSEEPVEESTDDEDAEKHEDSDDSEESEQADAARPAPGRWASVIHRRIRRATARWVLSCP